MHLAFNLKNKKRFSYETLTIIEDNDNFGDEFVTVKE